MDQEIDHGSDQILIHEQIPSSASVSLRQIGLGHHSFLHTLQHQHSHITLHPFGWLIF